MLDNERAALQKKISHAIMWTILVGIFNFSNESRIAQGLRSNGLYRDLVTGEERTISEITVPGQGFFWLKRL